MNSWGRSACYPRRTFYPLSDGPSIQNHRITMSYFRTCLTCWSRSQPGLCHCPRQRFVPAQLRCRVVSGEHKKERLIVAGKVLVLWAIEYVVRGRGDAAVVVEARHTGAVSDY